MSKGMSLVKSQGDEPWLFLCALCKSRKTCAAQDEVGAMKRERDYRIDNIRALAITLVVLGHSIIEQNLVQSS